MVPTGRKRAFCSIKTQFENVGDALIVRELISLIAARQPITVDLSRCPPEFRKTLGIDSNGQVSVVARGFPALIWQMLKVRFSGERCTYFLIPGGLGGEKSRAHAAKARVFNLILRGMKIAGIRACQVGVSYERLGTRHIGILKSRTRILYRHMVRDTLTQTYAGGLGLKVDGVLPDMAFNLFRSPVARAADRPSLAFSFRVDKSASQETAISAFIERVCRLAGKDSRFKFISQVGRDDRFMREMADKINDLGLGAADFVSCSDDIDACQEAYADCKALYSNRLHGLMLAMSAGATPFALIDDTVDRKILGIFQDAGWSSQIHPLGGTLTDQEITASFAPSEPVQGSAQVAQLDAFFDQILA